MIHFKLIVRVLVMILTMPLMIKLIKNKKTYINTLLSVAFYLYIVELIGIVFFPIEFDFKQPNFIPNVNFIPFHTISDMLKNTSLTIFVKQVLGNIFIFIPLGFLVPCLFTSINKEFKILKLSLLTSFFIELVQFIINISFRHNIRASDIDDIILNVLGALIGFEIEKLVFKLTLNKYIKDNYNI